MSTTETEPVIDFGEIAKVYPFHQETYNLVKYELGLTHKPWSELTLAQGRAQTHAFYDVDGKEEFDGTVKEMFVSSPDVEGGIPISVYTPASKPDKPKILIFFPGGGLVMSSREITDVTVKLISAASGVIIVSVAYRLLPDSELLAPFKDSDTVTRWVLANKLALGGVAESKIGVGGESAGGLLACNVGFDIKNLDFQVLIYPMVDIDLTVKSCKEFQSTMGIFNTDAIHWIHEMIKPHENVSLYTPGTRPEVSSSPPTLVLQAQLDPIRDWGIVYGDKLRAAGVRVQVDVVEGVPHGFLSLPTIFKTTSKQAASIISDFLKTL